VLPPLPRAMFWLGPVAEQALVVNVRGFGLVLVTGCGHPRIEQILAVTEEVLGIPIQAVIGGLHLPVHALGTPLIPQAVLGNPHWPWRPIGEDDVAHVLAEVEERRPRLVALSGHDSTPWTFDAFTARFADSFRPLRVGEWIKIDTSGPVSAATSA
jgi:7,8-dihydropterin-6-yl-methyl-4-(beta-D-ribofuranosyl)aminobenzene 5'-phosphate synthase